MANKFILKRSSVAGKVPLSTDLAVGELSVNLTDKLLFTKDAGGTVIALGGGTSAAATNSTLGLVKGFTNLTIDGSGSLSLAGGNVTAALGYSPANSATVTGDWNVKTNGQLSLISGNANSYNGTTALSGIYLPHATGAYGTNIAGRLDTLYFRTEENGTWASWRKVLHEGNFSTWAVPWTGGTFTGGLTVQTGSTTGRNAFQSTNDASNYMQMEVRGSAESGTFFGKTLANWGYVRAAGGTLAGLMLGTTTVAPVLFGTSNIEAGQITASGQRWLIGGATDDGTTRFQVSGNVSATAFIGSAASLTGLTSTQVTTALGFTPYNATNPSGYTNNTGTVTSVALSVPTGLSITGSPVTTSGTLAVSLTAGYSIPTTASQANWDTAYTNTLRWDGGATGLNAATGRTSLGATTLGSNIFTLANPSAISFLRVNADNTVSALDATSFKTALGISAAAGTVTSVAGTGTVSGLTLTGTVTSSGSLTLGGTLAVTPSNFASQTANTVLAAPAGAAGVPTFRSLVTGDLPTTLQTNTYAPGATGSTSPAVTAAGTTQATATALTSDINIITTSTAGTGLGVVMMGATSGKYAVVVNRSANAINLYPASGHAFDGQAVNAPISIPVNGFIEMFGSSTTQWHTTYQAVTQASFAIGALTTSNYGSYALPLSGGTLTGALTSPKNFINRSASQASGISWYTSTYSAWTTYMSPAAATGCGPSANITAPSGSLVTSWALRNFIENSAGYGWTWESGTSAQVTPTVVAEILASDGSFRSTGNITAYSDERAKTNWRDLPADFIEQLARVKYGIYDRIDTGVTQAGVSAQSLLPVLAPTVVVGSDKEKTLSVAYGNAALVSAIALAERVVKQEAQIARLEMLVGKLIGE